MVKKGKFRVVIRMVKKGSLGCLLGLLKGAVQSGYYDS